MLARRHLAADRSGALGKQLQPLLAERRSAGFVWVFLRKTAPRSAGR